MQAEAIPIGIAEMDEPAPGRVCNFSIGDTLELDHAHGDPFFLQLFYVPFDVIRLDDDALERSGCHGHLFIWPPADEREAG